ncbi:hypothetical protein NJH77_21430 [Serratia fonticola]|uniref:hypothetical protein n=1 Tax=Serratia fonticola TaxID=47917 RepID=UPI002096CCCE|nr:hypothetical protein [Serratia fonticola]MCO7511816.1 hypothetical protein [Serratia fonticola]
MKNIVENQCIKNDKPVPLSYEQLKARLDAVVAECATLKQFFQKGIEISFDGCDWDGGSIQDFAFGIGLLRQEAYDATKHQELVSDPTIFENGDEVYFVVKTPTTTAALAEVETRGVEKLADAWDAETAKIMEGPFFYGQIERREAFSKYVRGYLVELREAR